MKLEDLSLHQVAMGVSVLGLLNWTALQYAILPGMPEERRRQLYADSAISHSLYGVSLAFVVFAAWFVFGYQTSLQRMVEKWPYLRWRSDRCVA